MPRPAESMEVTRDKKNQLFWYPMKRERFTPRLMENLNKIDQTLQTDLGEASMVRVVLTKKSVSSQKEALKMST